MRYMIACLALLVGGLTGAVAQDSTSVVITSSVVVEGTDTVSIVSDTVKVPVKLDTLYLPADTVWIPCDSTPPDTLPTPPDTLPTPPDTLPTPPSDALWFSDFETLGSSSVALRDGGKWDALLNNGNSLSVVSASDLDFPTTNVLRVGTTARGGTRGGAYSANIRLLEGSGVIPIPAVGEDIFYRWYIRIEVPNAYTADNLTHPIQDGMRGGSDNWQFEVVTLASGRWIPRFFTGTGGTSWPMYRWVLPTLEKQKTYRFEMQFHRNGTNSFQIHVRVYDAADQLLITDANIQNVNGSARLNSNPSFQIERLSYLRGWQIGLNGFSSGSSFGWVYSYQGALAVCIDDWCGAR